MLDVRRMKAKVVLLGEGGVGKTSLIRRFVLNVYDDKYLHTLGTKVSKIALSVPFGDIEVEVDLTIFDIMGQKGFRDMVKETYLHGAQGYLAVCDVTRRETLTALHEWLAAVAEQTGSIPGLIVVNKIDLADQPGALPEDGAEQLAEMYDASVAHTSAKTGTGVEQAFSTLAVDIVEQAFRDDRAREAGQAFRRRLLALLAKRGTLGANKQLLMQEFRGMNYAELERDLQTLEGEGLVRLSWRGPGDFTVLMTERGARAAPPS